MFNDWVKQRNEECATKCPADLLQSPYPPAVLDRWIAAFILEARRNDGMYYTPDSLNCLLAGIQRCLRENLGRCAPNIIDKKSDLFPQKKHALDKQLRFLRSEGIGVLKKRASVIPKSVEHTLWSTGALSLSSPQGLLNTVFYCNGKNFCLRGISEQYSLRFSQIVRCWNPDRYQYLSNMGPKTMLGEWKSIDSA